MATLNKSAAETERAPSDAELKAMTACVRYLAGLEAITRRRVLCWLNERYPAAASSANASGNGGAA